MLTRNVAGVHWVRGPTCRPSLDPAEAGTGMLTYTLTRACLWTLGLPISSVLSSPERYASMPDHQGLGTSSGRNDLQLSWFSSPFLQPAISKSPDSSVISGPESITFSWNLKARTIFSGIQILQLERVESMLVPDFCYDACVVSKLH